MSDVTKIILVEGPRDEAFFRALLDQNEIQGFWVIQIGGKDSLGVSLKNLRQSPTRIKIENKEIELHFEQITHLAIIRDSDENPVQALQSVTATLKSAKLPAPHNALEWAAAPENENLQVGFALLPDERTPGALEKYLIRSIEETTLDCVKGFLACALQADPDRFSNDLLNSERLSQSNWTNGVEKNVLHVFGSLFFQKDPNKNNLESSFRQPNCWPLDHATFTPLLTFLQQAASA